MDICFRHRALYFTVIPINGTSPQPNERPSFQYRPWPYNESPVAAHFTSEDHTEIDMSVMIIDRCWREDALLRKIRESRWITVLALKIRHHSCSKDFVI